ncbi:MAG: peptide-binding protein [Acidobacteriota bacterium]
MLPRFPSSPAARSRLALLAGAALVLAAHGGCRGQGRAGAVLNAYLSTEPASLNFITQNDHSTRTIGKLICDPLVDFDRGMNLVPRLASSWESEDGGRIVTFHLRPGVRWHDGAPFTARDVAFTLEKVLDPASLATGKRAYFETVTSHQVLDDDTIRIIRREPYARAVQVWEALPILPRHLYASRDFLEASANRSPVGTGPYRFVSWEAGSRIVLRASREYFGPHPGIEAIVFHPLPDPNTRVQALLAGDLDLTSLRPLDRERILAHPDLRRKVRLLTQDTLYVWYIAWNQDGSNPFFGDRRVRLAMTRALDRQRFVDRILKGLGQVATSLIHPSMWAFDARITPWSYAPDASADLLAEAGWSDHDGDGLRDRNHTPFRFTLMLPAGNQEVVQLATLLQESLRTLGVQMRLRVLEYNLFRRQRDAGLFQAMLNGWMLDPDPDCYEFWHSGQGRGIGLNYVNYHDPEMDRLCEEGRKVVDRSQRRKIYVRVQEILHRDQPNTFIAYRKTLLGLSRRLTGVETSPLSVWGWYPGPLAWRIQETP